jgi:hypothetical protein
VILMGIGGLVALIPSRSVAVAVVESAPRVDESVATSNA